jgi:Peptidase M15
MRRLTNKRRCHTRRGPGMRPRLIGLGLAIVAVAGTAGQSAHASVDENWAGPVISQMMAAQEPEPGRRGRARDYDPEDDGVRPQRRTPLKNKRAAKPRGGGKIVSLGRDVAPAQLPPLSIIEWARPNRMEVVLPPGEITSAPLQEVGPMVASLGRDFVAAPPSAKPSLTGDGIKWLATASLDCLAAPLRTVLTELAAAFGPFTVRWTCRSKAVNRRVGGAKRSFHLTGNAVDFNMTGNFRAILSFLKASKLVGGLKHYGGGAFHIDTGPRRTW